MFDYRFKYDNDQSSIEKTVKISAGREFTSKAYNVFEDEQALVIKSLNDRILALEECIKEMKNE